MVVVPEALLDAERSWRRLVTLISTDTIKKGAYALHGTNLEPGLAYTITDGAYVVAVDRISGIWHIRLLQVAEHELREVKTWEQKSPLGQRIVNYIGKRLPPPPNGHRALRAETIPNRYRDRCRKCRQTVQPGKGIVLPREAGTKHATVTHLGPCPPPPPPPEIVSPNRRSEPCMNCGRWVEYGTGIARRLTARDEVTGSWYRACHDPECPTDALWGPRNASAGWCRDCGRLVKPNQGWRDPGTDGSEPATSVWPVRHIECPPPFPYPTWAVKIPYGEEPAATGEVRRVRVDLRGGIGGAWVGPLNWVDWRRPDNPDMPTTVPGFRVLRDTWVEMIGVVEEVTKGRGRRVVMRAATPEEASDLLAREMKQAASRPAPDTRTGHKGVWSAEVIQRCRPWLAEILGRDPDYGYERIFPYFRADYRDANSKGTRGVWYHWTLTPGHIYEAEWPLSVRKSERAFLRCTPEGDVVTITKREVETWLNEAAAWIAAR